MPQSNELLKSIYLILYTCIKVKFFKYRLVLDSNIVDSLISMGFQFNLRMKLSCADVKISHYWYIFKCNQHTVFHNTSSQNCHSYDLYKCYEQNSTYTLQSQTINERVPVVAATLKYHKTQPG